mgnify:CR=1 FL=1
MVKTTALSYDFYYIGYLCNYLTLDQVKQGVVDGDLTKDQYKQITGLDYTA